MLKVAESKTPTVPGEPCTTNPRPLEDFHRLEVIFNESLRAGEKTIVLPSMRTKALTSIPIVVREYCALFSMVETWQLDNQTTLTDSFLKSLRAVDSYLAVLMAHQAKLGCSLTHVGFPTACGFCGVFNVNKEDVSRAIGALTVLSMFGKQEAFLKAHTAHFLARALQQSELPPLPEGQDFLLFNNFRFVFPSPTFIHWATHISTSKSGKCRKHRGDSRIFQFAYNFYQAKNGTFSPSSSMVEDALKKHQKILSQPHEEILDDTTYDGIADCIKRCSREIFGSIPETLKKEIPYEIDGEIQYLKSVVPNPRFNTDASAPLRVPSLGASFGTNRVVGGALGELFGSQISDCKEVIVDRSDPEEDSFLIDDGDVEIGLKFNIPSPTFVGFAVARNYNCKKYATEVYVTADLEELEDLELLSAFRARNGEDKYLYKDFEDEIHTYRRERNSLINDVYERYLHGEISPVDICLYHQEDETYYRQYCDKVHATVVPLLEAFKVRTITKGSADAYHLGRRWQKVIHSRMRKHPAAALMGQPADDKFLTERILKNPLGKGPNSFYVSGDYESATDNLDPDLSVLAQEEISSALNIPLEDRIVLNRILTQHHLYYNKSKDATDPQCRSQIWGQLMGSPASFPVLCLINLAATLYSFESVMGRKLKLRDLPICVNGDDILFRSVNQDHYTIWKEITMKCGLKFSIGKNYTHKRLLVINSELYKVTRGDNAVRMPIMNCRLLYGGSRSSATGESLPPSLERVRISSTKDWTNDRLAALLGGDPKKFDRQSAIDRYLKKQRAKWIKDSANRRIQAERWYVTLPQRQATFHKQLDGGFMRDGAWFENAQKEFNERQLLKYDAFFGLAEKTMKIPSVSFHLPRVVGGLGLCPLSDHQFKPFEVALYHLLTKDESQCKEYVRFITPQNWIPSAMKSISLEIARVRDILGCPDLEIERDGDSWDETLERYGIEDEDYTGKLVRGFLNKNLWLSPDDIGEGFEKLAKISERPGYKIYSRVQRTVKRRLNKWKKEFQDALAVPAQLDLNDINIRSALYQQVNKRVIRVMPILPSLN